MSTNILEALDNLTVSTDSLTTKIGQVGSDLEGAIADLAEAMKGFKNCGCAGDGEHTEPDEVLDETDPPPPGFSEHDDVTFPDRKCKISNMIYDDILDVTKKLVAFGIGDTTETVSVLTGIIGFVMSSLAGGPMGFAMGILGAISGLVAFLLTNLVDLQGLVGILEDPQVHEDFVNALYNASSSQEGYDDAQAVLTAAGASSLHLAYLDAVKFLAQLTVLFFLPDGEDGVLLNQRLDGYVVSIVCTEEADPCELTFNEFTSPGPQGLAVGEGDLTLDGQVRTLTSHEHPSNGYHYIIFQVTGGVPTTTEINDSGDCQNIIPGECSNPTFDIEFVSHTDPPEAQILIYGGRCIGGTNWDQVYNGVSPPDGTSQELSVIRFAGQTPSSQFSVDVILREHTP